MTFPEKDPDVIVLSEGQQQAEADFTKFVISPSQKVMVLEGYPGTGKSTLVKMLLGQLPKLVETLKLLLPNEPEYDIVLTATTNKAAEALAGITGQQVKTIHSHLGLIVRTDYKTGETTLEAGNRDGPAQFQIIVIDEASMVDWELKKLIEQETENCKIMYIGDPYQLLAVNSASAPVFTCGYPTSKLTEPVRQPKDSVIIPACADLRRTIDGHGWNRMPVDGNTILRLDRNDFDQAVVAEFTRKDWHYSDSKILVWRNAAVLRYNNGLNKLMTGVPSFAVGDYAVVNKRVTRSKGGLKTDQIVLITGIEDAAEEFGVPGRVIEVNHYHKFFMPVSLEAKNERVKLGQSRTGEWKILQTIDNEWIDLRANYAQTVNKSQGSTYNQVFIDLNDINACRNMNNVARMLHVGISRARFRVTFTGNIT